MSTSRHREAAGRSRATGRGYPYRLQDFGAGPRRFRKRCCRRGGAVSGLPTEDRGSADYGPVDSFPHWSPRQRDSRWTSKREKVNATATETTNSVRRQVGLATRHRQALGCHSVI
ncbi:hypothetical protein PoB_006111900 [Plakobranchus ocellatus]|uniref:Uncharacterized protein n=1 Tax=Plakobranchus ocellatus TaxID=259542 RepID=A0AAV4CRW6_9GAST|nr:hypothetical protein PoB_006111900 [Plakobranchus ocellatus]